jgi:hypothetical protein
MKKLIALAALLALGGTAATQAAEFRSSDIHPEDYPTVLAVRHMGETIAKATNGKHSVKVFAKSALGSEKDTIEQTKLGALAMTRVNVAPMNNICPATMVPTMPFLFRSPEHMRKVLDGPIGDEILKDCEAQGFIGLAFYDSGSRSIYSVKKPVKTIADTKGMKIRVQQSDLWVDLMGAMGANATPMPFARSTPRSRPAGRRRREQLPELREHAPLRGGQVLQQTEHSMAPEILLFSKKVGTPCRRRAEDHPRCGRESVGYMRKLWTSAKPSRSPP